MAKKKTTKRNSPDADEMTRWLAEKSRRPVGEPPADLPARADKVRHKPGPEPGKPRMWGAMIRIDSDIVDGDFRGEIVETFVQLLCVARVAQEATSHAYFTDTSDGLGACTVFTLLPPRAIPRAQTRHWARNICKISRRIGFPAKTVILKDATEGSAE